MEEKSSERRYVIVNILVLTGLAVLTLIFGSLYATNYERRNRQKMSEQLSSIAELKVADIVQWRSERLGDCTVLSAGGQIEVNSAMLFASPQDEAARGRLVARFRTVCSVYGYDGIFLINSSGATLARYPEDLASDSVLEAEAKNWTGDKPGATFQDFYRSPEDGLVYLAVMAPVGSGNRRGFLALRIDPEEYLYPFIQRWPTESQTAETLIVRREGGEVVFLNPLRFRQDADLTLRFRIDERTDLPAIRALSGVPEVFEGVDYRDIPVLSALRPIPGSPWFLVARMDLREVDAPTREGLFTFSILIIVLIGIEAAGVASVSRNQRLKFYRKSLQAAWALRESEERLRLALAAAHQGLYDLNLRTGVIIVNDEYAAMLGYDPATFHETDQSLPERLHPDDRERVSRLYAEYIAGRQPEYRVEFRLGTRDGRWIWVLSLGKIIQWDASGSALRMIGTHTDITDRKTAEELVQRMNQELERGIEERSRELTLANRALAASNRELESFAYSVAHDLRAPLRAMDGFSRILEEDHSDKLDAEGLRILGVVRESVRRMDRLIGELLEISRLGRTELRPREIDMEAMARDIFHKVTDPEAADGFQFILEPLPAAFADPLMLEHVWSNLISNAVKYSMPSPAHRIEISGYVHENQNIYKIKDYGIGFDPKYAEKIFELFQRLHGREEFEGSGVGLSIVLKIIERHGGKVWAESRPEEGASFYFSLPIRS